MEFKIKKLISLAANFVKYTGLSSIWIYLLNHKNCEIIQPGVSGLEETCAFYLIKISLQNGKSFLSDAFFKKILEPNLKFDLNDIVIKCSFINFYLWK